MEEFSKQTWERYARAFNFYNRLSRWAFSTNQPVLLTLSSGVASARKQSDNSDATSDVLQTTSVGIDGYFAVYSVKGGLSGTNYIITLRMTLSDTSQIEEDVLMKVADE